MVAGTLAGDEHLGVAQDCNVRSDCHSSNAPEWQSDSTMSQSNESVASIMDEDDDHVNGGSAGARGVLTNHILFSQATQAL